MFGIQNGRFAYLIRWVLFLGGVSFVILVSAPGLVTVDPVVVTRMLSGATGIALLYLCALKWRKRRADSERQARMASALVSAVRGSVLLREQGKTQIQQEELSSGEEWISSFELPNLAPSFAARILARAMPVEMIGRTWQALRRRLATKNEEEEMETVEVLASESIPATGKRLTRWWKQITQCFKNDRSSERRLSGVGVKIWWADRNGGSSLLGVCVDVSAGGMAVLCAQPLPAQVRLKVQLQADRDVRQAVLRHCQQHENAYLMGLQFVEPQVN